MTKSARLDERQEPLIGGILDKPGFLRTESSQLSREAVKQQAADIIEVRGSCHDEDAKAARIAWGVRLERTVAQKSGGTYRDEVTTNTSAAVVSLSIA